MIFGQKIRLRSVERADLPNYVKWFDDPEVRDGLSLYLPLGQANEEQWFENMLKRERHEQPFAVDGKKGSKWIHIGSTGFHNLDWRNHCAEFGIVIGDKNFWNHGYGTDTVRTVVGLGFGELNLDRIFLRVFDTNKRAMRCYEKAGFVLEGRLRRDNFHNGQYRDTLIMSILRDEWEKRTQ